MAQLPKEWDMFYFMSMKHERNSVQQVSPRIAKLNYGMVLKCYAINAKMYEQILQALENALSGQGEIEPVDNVIATLHAQSNCYVATPPLTYRLASESLVLGGRKKERPPEEWANWQSDAASPN